MRKLLISASLVLMLLAPFLWQATAHAAPGDFLFQWGTPQILFNPSGVGVDSAGNTYVAEYDKHRVRVFDKSGNVLRSWGSYGSGNGQFSYPGNLAVAGNLVYVADTQNNRIQVFDTSGNFIRAWGSFGSNTGQFAHPVGIALDSKGNVYVADTENSRVQIFDGSGNYIKALTSAGDEGLGQVLDVTVDGAGNTYVSSGWEMFAFDNAGNFLRSWYIYGYNFRLATDSSGQLYLTVTDGEDYETDEVQVYDSNGNFLRSWGHWGLGDNEFRGFTDLAVGADGNVYVAEGLNNRIQVFDSSGNFVRKIGGTNANGQFYGPSSMAADANGNIYVADKDNFRIQVFDSNGNFLRKYDGIGWDGVYFTERLGPLGVAADTSGNVYAAYVGHDEYSGNYDSGNIEVLDSTGNVIRRWSLYPDQARPSAVAVAGNGNVFVADVAYHQVTVYGSSGNMIRSWGTPGSGNSQFSSPTGLALDGSGNVFVADSGNHRIQVFNGNGTFLRAWGSQGSGDGQFYLPTYVAVDAGGNVYVTDYDLVTNHSRIQVFDTTGKFLGKWGSYGTGDGQFLHPAGIAAIPAGNVYVADAESNRIEAFAGFGSQLPAGWSGRDIGSVGVAGRASYANGTFTLQGSGANIWGTADAFYYLYKPLAGDGQIVARVTSVQNTNGYAKGGVMIRETLTANSAHAMMDIQATAGAEFSRRLSTGSSTTVTGSAGITAPYWVKLVRQGSTFSGYISSNGTTWTLVGSATINMASSVYIGLVANSHNNTVLCSTSMDQVATGQTVAPTVTITAPVNGATYTAPATVAVTASATAGSGATVSKVEFFAGSTLIGTATGTPYSVTWSNVAAGSYSLTAKVTDSAGATATSTPVAITVNPGGLPAPWLTQDIGSVGVAGSASLANGTFTVKGSGANIYGTADAFRFVYQPLNGNGQIVARVLSVQNTNAYAKAGVMIRQSLTAGSMHAMIDITPTSGAEFSRRTTTGGTTTPNGTTGITAPYWVKLVRSGNTFTGSISSDGVTWVQVGSASISMTSSVYVGLIVNSHNNTVLCTGTFDSVTVSGAVDSTAPTVTAFTIPATSSSLTVPITTLTATDDFGVTGYLVNESSTKPAATASGWSATAPTSYIFASTGSKTLYAWAKDAAGNVSNSRSATVTVSGGGLPTPWLTQDIGSVGLIGSATYANGVFTLNGSGADIWGTADAFRFVYKVMTGDGQIIARVASLQNTNAYAKGGVMFRNSLAANSMHAMMDLRPTGGAEFSRRTATGGTTSATTRTGVAAPYWVRLVRSGNTFTGSVSSDGVTWVQVGSATISMSSSVYVGLIVTSHTNSALCTTTIDGVK